MKTKYQICKRCIMDTTDPKISFDEEGICSNCTEYYKQTKEYSLSKEEIEQKLQKILEKIKEKGKNQEYDCIIGLSGGVDSSYLAYLVKEKWGLRPLALHLDNGWDSDIAANNIKQLVKKLGIDFHTLVINWEEFKDIQLTYFKASVLDIEAITDHAIAALLYKIADEKRIKYILSGGNITTEGIIPKSWTFNKTDLINLKDIHKKFGKIKLKTFPMMGIYKWLHYTYIKKIKYLSLLNYVPYIRKDAKEFLIKELGWRDYGGKHSESIFTKFYQNYILPKKFNIDKRRAHLSTLICSGQITREEALKEVEKNPYDKEELERDKEYVLKKLGLSNEEFEEIMSLSVKNHTDYKSDIKLRKFLGSIYRLFKKFR